MGPAGFNAILRDLTRRVAALENGVRASRTTVRNGLLIIADDEGRTTLAVGKQPDGKVALRVFDPATGAVQVSVGTLADDSYGLEQIDPATGMTVPLSAIALGTVISTDTSAVLTSSTTFVDLGGPEVTATATSTGKVEVTAASQIAPPMGGGYGDVGLSIDGGTAVKMLGAYSPGTSIVPGAGLQQFTGLAPGPHTFRLMYRVGPAPTGDTDFRLRTIKVRPY